VRAALCLLLTLGCEPSSLDITCDPSRSVCSGVPDAGGGNDAVCRKVCRLGSNSGCKMGQSCQPAAPSQLVPSPILGVCT
jgi:hypothetical protein